MGFFVCGMLLDLNMCRYVTVFLFIGLAWGQFNGSVELKSGVVYTGEITEVNASYVFLLADGLDNAQGIPITAISKSVLDDGTKVVENGIVLQNIENNQLIVPVLEELNTAERDCYMDGVMQAKIDYRKKGFINGCGYGLFFIPGLIIGNFINSLPSIEVPYELMKDLKDDCRWEFEKGYKTEAKKLRNSNFLKGAQIPIGIYALSWLQDYLESVE